MGLFEPFKNDTDYVESGIRFLLAHQVSESGGAESRRLLWTESPQSFRKTETPQSIWATGEILELLASCCLEGSLSDPLKAEVHKSIAAACQSLSELFEEHQAEWRNRQDEEIDLVGKGYDQINFDQGKTHKVIVEELKALARAVHGYYGPPRTARRLKQKNSTSSGTIEWSWGEFNMLAGCSLHRGLREVLVATPASLPNGLKDWIKSFTLFLASPGTGWIREGLHELQRKPYTSTAAPTITVIAKELEQRQLPTSDIFLPIVTWGKQVTENTGGPKISYKFLRDEPGCMFVFDDDNGNSHVGWRISPRHLRAPVSALATLYATEAIAGSLACSSSIGFTDEQKRHLVAVLERASESLEWFLAGDRGARELDSLDTLCRFVVRLSYIDRHLASIDAVDIKKRIEDLLERCVDRFFAKVKDDAIRQYPVLFDPVPIEIEAGEELFHWPGIDVGYVALAYGKATLSRTDPERERIKNRIQKLMTSQFRLHDGSKDCACGAVKNGDKNHSDLQCEFVSSQSKAIPSEEVSVTYTWSHAHALMALVAEISAQPQKAAGSGNASLSRQPDIWASAAGAWLINLLMPVSMLSVYVGRPITENPIDWPPSTWWGICAYVISLAVFLWDFRSRSETIAVQLSDRRQARLFLANLRWSVGTLFVCFLFGAIISPFVPKSELNLFVFFPLGCQFLVFGVLELFRRGGMGVFLKEPKAVFKLDIETGKLVLISCVPYTLVLASAIPVRTVSTQLINVLDGYLTNVPETKNEEK